MAAADESPAPPESYTWPLICIVTVIAAQVLVPADHRVGPPLIVPIIETAAFLAMLAIAAVPGPVPMGARPIVLAALTVLIAANAAASIRLVALVLGGGHHSLTAGRLLVAGALALLTNLVTFALFYWEIDVGGPAARAARSPRTRYPDFQFPQMAAPAHAPPAWQPRFPDYLYLAYTNVVAFSPTDAVPLTRRAKGLMALQSFASVSVLVVVLARVINILPT